MRKEYGERKRDVSRAIFLVIQCLGLLLQVFLCLLFMGHSVKVIKRMQ